MTFVPVSLTVVKLIAMTQRIVDAYVGGVTMHVVFTDVKDEPQELPGPVCEFMVPRLVPSVEKDFTLHDGWLMDLRFKMPVDTERTGAAASQAYSQIMEHAAEIFGAFLDEYILATTNYYNGDRLNLKIDPALPPVIEEFVDDGTANVSGCRLTFIIRDNANRCLKDVALFPSLHA